MIDTVIVHYTATYPGTHVTRAVVDGWHRQRGFREIGYHYLITEDGSVHEGRPEGTQGAGAVGFNSRNIVHIAWAGGIDRETGRNVGVWNINPVQEQALIRLIKNIEDRAGNNVRVIGHIDVAATDCPGLPRGGVEKWWAKHSSRKSLASSRTVVGSVAGTVGTAGAMVTEQANELMPLIGMSNTIQQVFLVLALAGIGLTLYARIDDWNKGKR